MNVMLEIFDSKIKAPSNLGTTPIFLYSTTIMTFMKEIELINVQYHIQATLVFRKRSAYCAYKSSSST